MPTFNFRDVNKSKYKNIDHWTPLVEHTVAFISYDGEYPNLCSGTLRVMVDDDIYIFPRRALGSGGTCGAGNNWEATHGPWYITQWPNDPIFQDEKVRKAVTDVVNTSVRQGCCGGCA